MNTSSNHILDTIISEVNSINEKLKDLNFLEILKNNLIEKLLMEKLMSVLVLLMSQLKEIHQICHGMKSTLR